MKIVALLLNMKTADIEDDRTNGIIPRFAELYGSRISQGREATLLDRKIRAHGESNETSRLLSLRSIARGEIAFRNV